MGVQLLYRFISAAHERRALGIASHRPFDQWGTFLPEQATAASLLDRLLHHAVVVTEGESFRMKEARTKGGSLRKKSQFKQSEWGLLVAKNGDRKVAIDTRIRQVDRSSTWRHNLS